MHRGHRPVQRRSSAFSGSLCRLFALRRCSLIESPGCSDWTAKSWEIVSEAMTQVLFTSTVSIADATRWIYQQFSPEVMAVSVAQISHHWLPTTAAVLPGAEISIEVASNSKIYPEDLGSTGSPSDPHVLASADGEMKV